MNSFEQALLRLKQQVGVQTDKDVAEMLGMTTTAFNARKKRDAFPEDKLLALVARRPDLAVDPQYVLTGMTAKDRFAAEHGRLPASYLELTEWVIGGAGHFATGQSKRRAPAVMTETGNPVTIEEGLPPDEQLLLEAYRGMTATARKALLAELLTGGKKPKAKPKASSEEAGIKVSGSGHRVAGRDFNERKE